MPFTRAAPLTPEGEPLSHSWARRASPLGVGGYGRVCHKQRRRTIMQEPPAYPSTELRMTIAQINFLNNFQTASDINYYNPKK